MFTDAVQRLQAAGLRYEEAQARLSLAEALLSTGEGAAASGSLVQAVGVLTELSATDDLARAHRLVAAAGAPSSGPLTSREREVLRLVSQGLSNQQVAATLVISEHTVHRRVADILTKLDQTARTGAASYALRVGLL